MCQNDSDEETIDRHFPLHPFHKVPWNDTRKEEYTVRLENLLENVNRDFISYLNNEDVDSASHILIDCVKQATQFREQLPYQSSFFSKSTKPQPIWWDEECKTLKFTKYRLLRSFHRSNDPLILNQYLEAKQRFKSACLKKKAEVDRTNIEDLNTAMSKNDSKDLWSEINKMLSNPYQTGKRKTKRFSRLFKDLLNPISTLTDDEPTDDDLHFESNNDSTDDDTLNFPITSRKDCLRQ
ncbi:retrovirus-related Pol polyprotein LINE-1 [Elysia marginata]|uniref:Retrovirus-related Pol polyprotein LINE-1 n=1 Tax=Elysia marginata TaxID=1093978 RepID=A0AAV4HNT1_9GAST|nr:retrovirus-related Pol polyprotein LINE-1 [Elysia marginata]